MGDEESVDESFLGVPRLESCGGRSVVCVLCGGGVAKVVICGTRRTPHAVRSTGTCSPILQAWRRGAVVDTLQGVLILGVIHK